MAASSFDPIAFGKALKLDQFNPAEPSELVFARGNPDLIAASIAS